MLLFTGIRVLDELKVICENVSSSLAEFKNRSEKVAERGQILRIFEG